jgi:DNA-binding MarR family transcriptional regulator
VNRPTFDELIHAPNRLQVCAILAAVDTADFATVRSGLGVSDSVLSKHVAVLEVAGYVAVEKVSFSPRMKTRLTLTPAGRDAYEAHVAALRAIVDRGVGRASLPAGAPDEGPRR